MSHSMEFKADNQKKCDVNCKVGVICSAVWDAKTIPPGEVPDHILWVPHFEKSAQHDLEKVGATYWNGQPPAAAVDSPNTEHGDHTDITDKGANYHHGVLDFHVLGEVLIDRVGVVVSEVVDAVNFLQSHAGENMHRDEYSNQNQNNAWLHDFLLGCALQELVFVITSSVKVSWPGGSSIKFWVLIL